MGLTTVEIFIPQSQSLKDKRQVLRRIKDKVKAKLNVSYAEVDYQDKWQRSTLSFVTVANKRADVDRRFESVIKIIEGDIRVEILNRDREYL